MKRSSAWITAFAGVWMCASAFSAAAAPKPAVIRELPPPDPSYAALDVNQNYRIGPLDKLMITVFQVDEMKTEVQVDASGNISLPLLGGLSAAGKTTVELANEIAAKLDARYLRSPQVTVLVEEAQSQRITVGGAVIQPGMFEIKGHTTLLAAVALAHGVDRIADLKKVSVFRTVNGTKMVAVVDMRAVQTGAIADPEIYGDDIVIVSASGTKTTLRDLSGVAPLFNFIPLLR